MSLFKYAKRLARVFPKSWRQWFWRHGGPFAWAARRMMRWLERHAPHADMYDAEYYAYVDECMGRSAGVMAESITRLFAPRSVIDVGCGSGLLLATLRVRGVSGIGLEYSEAGIDYCRKRGLDVRPFDIEAATPFAARADLVISTEVAEHLPATVADRYVDQLCALSDRVLITAAQPGQGGTDHVNEQPHSYWIEKFLARGFRLDEAHTETLRTEWRQKGTESWYSENIMVFSK